MKKIKWMISLLSCLISMFIVVVTNTEVDTRVYIMLGICIVIAVVVFLLVDQISNLLTDSAQRYGEKYKVDFMKLLSEQINCFANKQAQYISEYKEEVANVYKNITDVTAKIEKTCKESAVEWKESNVEMKKAHEAHAIKAAGYLGKIAEEYEQLANALNKHGELQKEENSKLVTNLADQLNSHITETTNQMAAAYEKSSEAFSTSNTEMKTAHEAFSMESTAYLAKIAEEYEQLANALNKHGELQKEENSKLVTKLADQLNSHITETTNQMAAAYEKSSEAFSTSNTEMKTANNAFVAEIKGLNSTMIEQVKELSVRMSDDLGEIVKAYKDLENSLNSHETMQQEQNNKFITKVSDELGMHSKEMQSIVIDNNNKLQEFTTDLSECIAGNVEDYKDVNSDLVRNLEETMETKLEDSIDRLKKESRRNVQSIEEAYETWGKDNTAMLMKLSELFEDIQKSQNNLLVEIDRRQENYQLMSSEELSIMKGLLK